MPKLKSNNKKPKTKLENWISSNTKIDTSEFDDKTKGRVKVYIDDIKAHVWFAKKKGKTIDEQVDEYMKKIGLSAINLSKYHEGKAIKFEIEKVEEE